MRQLKLPTKFFLASSFILVIFFLVIFGILFHALKIQAIQEMDQLLEDETLSLSVFVNSKKNGTFNFEMSPLYLSQYQSPKSNRFFRFLGSDETTLLKESRLAPQVNCMDSKKNRSLRIGQITYRVQTYQFRPEIDDDDKSIASFVSPLICLIVGIDEEPYHATVVETLKSVIPPLIGIIGLLMVTILILIWSLTRDLSKLTSSLSKADFGATHAFPILPVANTPEVRAIIEKLQNLHSQASDIYREMWFFLGRASHQIKTPIAAMQATLDVLLRKERTKEELVAGLEDVKLAAKLLNVLTKNLISSSRISYQNSPLTEKIDLNSFIFEIIEIFRFRAEQNNVILEITSRLPVYIYGNQSLMSDVFGNLIENAILYSSKKTFTKVTIGWELISKSVRIEICDEGPGFSKDVIASLFQPFVRGDEREIAGSGLGLSIVQKSAHILGGTVELKESTSQGSKILVTLPIATD